LVEENISGGHSKAFCKKVAAASVILLVVKIKLASGIVFFLSVQIYKFAGDSYLCYVY